MLLENSRMLKHATPRSSPSLGNPSSTYPRLRHFSTTAENGIEGNHFNGMTPKGGRHLVEEFDSYRVENHIHKPFNERGVDCEGIVSAEPLQKKVVNTGGFGSLFADKFLGRGTFGVAGGGIGPVITHGRAIVRRGLSFNSKKEADSQSVRSVKSEGKGSDTVASEIVTKSQSEASVIQHPSSQELRNEEKPSHPSTISTLLPSQKKDPTPPPLSKESLNPKLLKDVQISSKEVTPPKSQKSDSSSDSKIDHHPTLKSLLRLPGVYGHIPVPENAPPNSPHIVSPDSLSLDSTNSFRSSNSGRNSSRSWQSNTSSTSNNTSQSSSNCSSSSEPAAQTTLKVFAKCLRSDIEYKTMSLDPKTTCRELINILLSKVRMRHRDPNLFYLTMEVFVRKWSGMPVRALLVLEENARPAQLAMCRPPGDIRFALQMRKGGVVKIHDTVLMPGSQYKSLLISYRTTTEEVVQLLLNCYSRKESKHYYALHEVCQYPQYSDRRLGYVEKPLEVKAEWPNDRKAEYIFVLRRNMTQALSLRKLFLKTSEVLRENEEISTRKRSQLIPYNKPNGDINKNKLIHVEAELGIVVPEEAALIDCTSTTPIMKTFREANGIPKSNIRHVPCNNNNYYDPYPKEANERLQGNHPEKIRPWSVVGIRVNGELKSQQVPNNKIASTKRVHFSTNDTTDKPGIEPKNSKTKNHEVILHPNPSLKPSQISSKKSNLTSFLDQKQVPANNNLRFSIGAQTELTLISVKGLKANTHKWNSVETLIDTSPSDSEFKNLKIKNLNNSFSEDRCLPIHSSFTKGKYCEQNCKKCFYI